jgi:hypothetical protein
VKDITWHREEVVERAFDARTDAATARAFHGMPEDSMFRFAQQLLRSFTVVLTLQL